MFPPQRQELASFEPDYSEDAEDHEEGRFVIDCTPYLSTYWVTYARTDRSAKVWSKYGELVREFGTEDSAIWFFEDKNSSS